MRRTNCGVTMVKCKLCLGTLHPDSNASAADIISGEDECVGCEKNWERKFCLYCNCVIPKAKRLLFGSCQECRLDRLNNRTDRRAWWCIDGCIDARCVTNLTTIPTTVFIVGVNASIWFFVQGVLVFQNSGLAAPCVWSVKMSSMKTKCLLCHQFSITIQCSDCRGAHHWSIGFCYGCLCVTHRYGGLICVECEKCW